ncbi:MAG TPA: glycosyltransferase family 4 protein [Candidatus Methylomirabilis sp.]|nr:glycosyltransferase family 4 protein [Candidatus Methylomirabilis sp.]
MKVAILTQYYSPEPIPKPHEMARGLAERGHDVLVITAFPHYPGGRLYPGTRLRLWQRETRDGIRILRLPLYPDHSRSPIRRTINYGSFAVSAAVLGTLLSGRVDAMCAEQPPLSIGLAAWVLGRVRGAPFVYSVNDLWPESVEATGMLRSPQALQWMGRLERFVYRRAAAIVVISPGIRENLVGKGIPSEKVHVIPHWANESLYRPVIRDPGLARELGMADRFNVVFAGQLGLAQGLDVVLDAAEELSELSDIQFVLAGDGTDAARLRQVAADRRLGNVRFLGWQPAERMPSFFAVSEVLLVHLRDEPLFRITIPSKTIAYMACGRPVLMAVEGDAADLIRTTGAGVTCRAGDGKELAGAVRRLHATSPEARESMGRAGREAFLTSYSRSVLLDHYEKLLVEVTGRKGSGGKGCAS